MSHHWHEDVGVRWCPCDEDQEAPGVPTAAVPDPRPDCWCEPALGEPHPWQPAEINLCDHDGIVRRGAMHHGQDYQCTGSAHWSGLHVRCTTPIHGQGPVPVIGVLPKGGFR